MYTCTIYVHVYMQMRIHMHVYIYMYIYNTYNVHVHVCYILYIYTHISYSLVDRSSDALLLCSQSCTLVPARLLQQLEANVLLGQLMLLVVRQV